MIQAATRGKGNEELAVYLAEIGDNDEVVVLPARGVVAVDLRGQLREMVARSAHGRTRLPILHLHVDPATEWTKVQYKRHAELYEAEFNLVGQPRLAVDHLKGGRWHRHVVYSVVLPNGRTISLSNNFARHEKISRILEFEFSEPHVRGRHNRAVAEALRREGWLNVVESMEAAGLLELPRPLARQSSGQRSQEKRTGISQRAIDEAVSAVWNSMGDGPALRHMFESKGLILAMGREAPVLVDRTGNVHSLARVVARAVPLEGRLQSPSSEVWGRVMEVALLPVAEVRREVQVAAIFGDMEREMALIAGELSNAIRPSAPAEERLLEAVSQLFHNAAYLRSAGYGPAIDDLPEGKGLSRIEQVQGYGPLEMLFDEADKMLMSQGSAPLKAPMAKPSGAVEVNFGEASSPGSG